MIFLRVSGISRQESDDAVLRDISFSQKKLQRIGIAGETGSGKSTLLKIVAGLIQPDCGEVWLENKLVEGPAEKLVAGHPQIAYLSQHFELPRFLRVEQILTYANNLSDDEAGIVYDVCKIGHVLNRNTDHLSGGEKQRIAIARLLISSPKLLLLDEPFSNLDIIHKNVLRQVINDICNRLKITCILVSHDPHDILSWADRIMVMKHGQIVQHASPEEIYRQPHNEYVAGLFGKYNLIHHNDAKPFLHLAGMKPKGKNMIIRPEDFKFVSRGDLSLRGKVVAILFFGSYCEVQVLVLKMLVLIRTDRTNLKVESTVYVSFRRDHVCFV